MQTVMTDEQRNLAEQYWSLYYEAQSLTDGCNPSNGTPEGAAENQRKADAANAAAAAIAAKLRDSGCVLGEDGIWVMPAKDI